MGKQRGWADEVVGAVVNGLLLCSVLMILFGCVTAGQLGTDANPVIPPSKCQVVRSDGTSYDCPPWIFTHLPNAGPAIMRGPH